MTTQHVIDEKLIFVFTDEQLYAFIRDVVDQTLRAKRTERKIAVQHDPPRLATLSEREWGRVVEILLREQIGDLKGRL